MRRQDRRITDPAQMETILRDAVCCRLGLVEHDLAYIVPMNFGVAKEGGRLCLYFHSAAEGRKIDLIGRADRASFEADTDCAITESAQACGFSCAYQSVMGYGGVAVLTNERDKLRALRCIMEHYTGAPDWEFPTEALAATVCIRLEVEEMTAKSNF